MVASVAWGLLLLLAVLGLLRAADHEDRQKLDAVNRRIQAMMDALQPAPDPTAPPQNRPDMTNRSRQPGNGLEIAKSEGVSHGSSDVTVRELAPDRCRPAGEARHRAP